MPDRELKLNSISRFVKGSERLVLEEHGHCEVPAGCGGVVLRWRNPDVSIPIETWLHTSGEGEFYLDGENPQSSRPLVSYGEHLLAFRISGINPKHGVLMFAAFYDEKKMTHVGLSRASGKRVYVLSAADGSWKYSLNEPLDDDWKYLAFDDSAWPAMVAKAFLKSKERDTYAYKRLKEFGAKALGITENEKTIWIRKSFQLER